MLCDVTGVRVLVQQLLTNTCWQLNAHVHYPKGQTLIWSGEHIEKAYLIVQGKICVKDRDMVEVRTIHHHEVRCRL